MKWIIFVLFRTEKDQYQDNKKRQEDSDITSPRKGKYRQLYWPMLCYYWSNIAHFWSDSTHLCLAITALIFDNCYNGITLTFLDLNDSCNQLHFLIILEQFQDGRRTHKDEKKKKTWYEEPGRNSTKLRILEFSNLALRNGDYILETFLTILLEKDSFATSFSLNCTLNSAQNGWTNGGKTFSTHQLDGDLYAKHQDGSWTGMLNEIMKDLWKTFALSSSSISETKIIFV